MTGIANRYWGERHHDFQLSTKKLLGMVVGRDSASGWYYCVHSARCCVLSAVCCGGKWRLAAGGGRISRYVLYRKFGGTKKIMSK